MDRQELEQLMRSRIDGERAQSHVEEITKHYRTAGSSGFHLALEYLQGELTRNHISSRIETYPLDGKSELMGHKMALAWEPVSATVEITHPTKELITSYAETPTCMMWWSASTTAMAR